MTKPSSVTSAPLIITTFGTDGAAAAAAALLACDNAELSFTSAGRIAQMLEDVAAEKKNIGRVYICGVGIADNLPEVLRGLRALKGVGVRPVWFCGRGYMDEYAPELLDFCECVFVVKGSNTECVLDYFADLCGEDKRVALLRDLAEEFVRNAEPGNEQALWWHDFIRASAGRFFKYDQQMPFLDAIRKLAGVEPVTKVDEREVEMWRRGEGVSQPLGSSKSMRNLRQLISRLGSVDQPVLVLGPSGAGKEMVARLLHEASVRRAGPFVPVNCAVLSSNTEMAHDKLFGHIAGAYTGARVASAGAFEAADGGTLFLDEVGELPLAAQTQLLRALQEKEISPLGTVQARKVDVRVVAATNRNLARMVNDGTFRLDLYHRLNVLQLKVPALCERRDDIRSIAQAQIRQLAQEGYPLKLTAKDWDAAAEYGWPGNIRQLVNLLRRAAYMDMSLWEVIEEQKEEDRQAEISDSGVTAANVLPQPGALPESLDQVRPLEEIRREYAQCVFELCAGSTQQAAQLLGISANTLRALKK